MQKSLKNKLLNYLEAWYKYQPDTWIHKGVLEEKAKESGYLGDNCTRRLRELRYDGFIEHRLVNGSGQYRYQPNLSAVTEIVKQKGWKECGVIELIK